MSNREKYKPTQCHNKSISETGKLIWVPKESAKKFHQLRSLVLCLEFIYVHLVHFNWQNLFRWGKISQTVIRKTFQLSIEKIPNDWFYC